MRGNYSAADRRVLKDAFSALSALKDAFGAVDALKGAISASAASWNCRGTQGAQPQSAAFTAGNGLDGTTFGSCAASAARS
ncbi:hypothetical protein GCM10023192_52080 [Amycolatopsis samaneae]